MDLIELLKLIWRRRYVALPVLLLTAAAAVVMQLNLPREYEARGTLILATPEQDPSRSPLLPAELDFAVAQLRTQPGVASIVDAGGIADFTIQRVDDLRVVVRVPQDSEAAERTVTLVMERIRDHIYERQDDADIPEDERTQVRTESHVVEPDPEPEGEPTDAVTAEPSIETVGTLILVDPTGGRGNPYSASDSTSRVLQLALQSDGGRMMIQQLVGSEDFVGFGVSPQGSPGIIGVTTYAHDPTVALEAFSVVHEALSDELDRRQVRANVPTSRRLVLEVVAAPQEPIDVTGPVDRAVAAVVGLGGLLAVGLVLLVENLAPRVRDRRRSGTPDEAAPSRRPTYAGSEAPSESAWEDVESWWSGSGTTKDAVSAPEVGDAASPDPPLRHP